ncbi:MAG: transcription repressor NadR [Bilifractor sp.]|nr:transcription repressor NadR [Lachnospiraceae bacterium]MDY2837883.1 transcription repressor NadR [Bilifractor sp.]
MTGKERREAILNILKKSDRQVSGSALARQFSVSRQVIVQDIALLRAEGIPILSAARGYVLAQSETKTASRVFKVHHSPEQACDEMNLIVDCGGRIEDVFVYHRVYGIIRASMNIRSRLDVKRYKEEITGGKSSPLSNITDGYHYHTVTADSEGALDIIQKELANHGFLAPLQDYEPVDFWSEKHN